MPPKVVGEHNAATTRATVDFTHFKNDLGLVHGALPISFLFVARAGLGPIRATPVEARGVETRGVEASRVEA
jgi:hypothetical protein